MSPVAAPADRRFRRAHVKPARIRRSWRTWAGRLVAFGMAAGLLLFAANRLPRMAAEASVMRIDRIQVRGNERLSTGEVLALLSGLRGQSLLSADLDAWRARLLASPWVRDAELRRSLPSTVDVFLSEKAPLGIARLDGRLYLIDDRGVLIDEYGPQYSDFDLPMIDGLNGKGAAAGSVDGRRVQLASRVILALRARPDVAGRLSQIDVRDVHNVGVILNGDTAVIRLGEEQFLQRLQSYLDVAPALHERVADIDHVDVRFDGRIYVKPIGKVSKPASAPRKR
jgi:cell division protein FtsQ